MTVKVRPFVLTVNHAPGCSKRRCGPVCQRIVDGWEYDTGEIPLPGSNGKTFRERRRAKSTYFADALREGEERAARIRLLGKEERSKSGSEPSKDAMPTLDGFIERYISGHVLADGHKPSGEVGKRSILRNHLSPAFGTTKLDAIGVEAVQVFKGTLTAKGLAPATVNNIVGVLSSMLRCAVKWGVILTMPEIEEMPTEEPPFRFYDDLDYGRLIEAARALDPQILAMVLLGGDAGLRRGEIVGLEWGDIDFQRDALHISRSVCSKTGRLTPPKGGRKRIVPMTNRLRAALLALPRGLQGPVLRREDGRRLPWATPREWMRRVQRRAQARFTLSTGVLGDVDTSGYLHGLRHTFCSRLAMKGAPVKAIQEFAGHAEMATTMRYMHLSEGARKDAIRLLETTDGDGSVSKTGLEGEVP